MVDSKSGCPTRQTLPRSVREREGIAEDEVDLLDYLAVLWKRKNLVMLSSVLPALLVGGVLLLSPNDYKVTYEYDVSNHSRDHSGTDVGDGPIDLFTKDVVDRWGYPLATDLGNWNLNARSYNVLLRLFYSKENLDRLVDRLKKEGVTEYAKLISGARQRRDQERLVKFEAFPPYTDLSKVKQTDPTMVKRVREMNAQLLDMTITARPKDKLSKIFAVIRQNFESEISAYLVAEQLNVAMIELRARMARIERERFPLQLDLEKNKSVLAKLKGIRPSTAGGTESGVVLQFDIGARSEFLPIEYHIQFAELRIVELEETIKKGEKEYRCYKDLLGLNEGFLAKVRSGAPSGYTIQEFHLFLLEIMEKVEKEELSDYLGSYVKGIENRMAASAPITEYPSVYAVPKGAARKTAIVFAACLVMSIFAAFLFDGALKSRVPAS
jgi:hypothetical protein